MAAKAPRVCVIGAGSSGITACQVLHARGIEFDCFEKGSQVGGNWRYMNDNGMSAAYDSLSINTSRRIMEYAAYPMPDTYPDFPTHRQIASYFDHFVDAFGLRVLAREHDRIWLAAGHHARLGLWSPGEHDVEVEAGGDLRQEQLEGDRIDQVGMRAQLR